MINLIILAVPNLTQSMLENVATARLIPILAKLFRVEIFPPSTGSFPRSSLLSSIRSMPGSSPVGFYKTNVLDLVKMRPT